MQNLIQPVNFIQLHWVARWDSCSLDGIIPIEIVSTRVTVNFTYFFFYQGLVILISIIVLNMYKYVKEGFPSAAT